MDLCKIFDLLARPANDSSSASRRLGHFGIINNTRILSFPPPPPAFVRVSKKTEPAVRPAFVSPERVFPLVFLFLFFFCPIVAFCFAVFISFENDNPIRL